MPIDRPTPVELIQAVREFLLDKLAPNLEGQLAFHVRVSANVLGMIERTLESGAAMDQEELKRLTSLLGREGDLLELNELLAAAIREGDLDDHREELFDHLKATVADKLKLANPRYLTKGQ